MKIFGIAGLIILACLLFLAVTSISKSTKEHEIATNPNPVQVFFRGEQLREFCLADNEEGWKLNYCSGFIMGVFDSQNLQPGSMICAGNEISLRDVVDIVKSYALSHTKEEMAQDSAFVLVIRAISEKFPCQKGSTTDLWNYHD